LARELGLGKALEDGFVTEEVAKARGLDLEKLRFFASGPSNDSVEQYRELLACASVTLPSVKFLQAGALLERDREGDYLVIAPKVFHEALRPLLNHRAALGHKVAVVDPADVYAHYSDPTPAAIARFVTEARANWKLAPRYALIVGDGKLGVGVVPPILEKRDATGHGLIKGETFASDNRFGDIDLVGIPSVAVGRLPVATEAELNVVIDKIIKYEAVTPPGLWQTEATMIDGNPDWGNLLDAATTWYAESQLGHAVHDRDVRRLS
jgi:hypothetical protein